MFVSDLMPLSIILSGFLSVSSILSFMIRKVMTPGIIDNYYKCICQMIASGSKEDVLTEKNIEKAFRLKPIIYREEKGLRLFFE